MTQIKNIIAGIIALTLSICIWFIIICFTIATYNVLLARGNDVILMTMSVFMITNNVIYGTLLFIVGVKILFPRMIHKFTKQKNDPVKKE